MLNDNDLWIQIGVLHGGVGKCTSQDSPTVFVRLDDKEILKFVKCPETYIANRTCREIYGKHSFLSLKMIINSYY